MSFQIANRITCKKCSKKELIEHMQSDRYGEKMICRECVNEQNKPIAKRKVTKDGTMVTTRPERGSLFYSKNFKPVKKKERDEVRSTFPQEMYAYKCTRCNFEFKRRKAFPHAGTCPYCGKNSVAKDPIKSGQWVEKLWK